LPAGGGGGEAAVLAGDGGVDGEGVELVLDQTEAA